MQRFFCCWCENKEKQTRCHKRFINLISMPVAKDGIFIYKSSRKESWAREQRKKRSWTNKWILIGLERTFCLLPNNLMSINGTKRLARAVKRAIHGQPSPFDVGRQLGEGLASFNCPVRKVSSRRRFKSIKSSIESSELMFRTETQRYSFEKP